MPSVTHQNHIWATLWRSLHLIFQRKQKSCFQAVKTRVEERCTSSRRCRLADFSEREIHVNFVSRAIRTKIAKISRLAVPWVGKSAYLTLPKRFYRLRFLNGWSVNVVWCVENRRLTGATPATPLSASHYRAAVPAPSKSEREIWIYSVSFWRSSDLFVRE